MTAAALEAEVRCIPRGTVVGGEVVSGRVCRHCHIGLVLQSGGDAVICFSIPARTKGTTYSIVGGGLIFQWRRTISTSEAEANREFGKNSEEV